MEKSSLVCSTTKIGHLASHSLAVDGQGQNLYNAIALLAMLGHMSLCSFGRTFKKTYATSPATHLKIKRLENAADLLLGSDLPVSQVAYDASLLIWLIFPNLLRSHFGAPPSAYRKIHFRQFTPKGQNDPTVRISTPSMTQTEVMHDCIFCQIVRQEAKSWKVYENDHIYSFLDINPVNAYHTLVIPKAHYQDIFDLPSELFQKLAGAIKDVTTLYRQKLGIEHLQIVNSSGEQAQQDVFHVHFHIVPRYWGDGQDIVWTPDQSLRASFDEQLSMLRQ